MESDRAGLARSPVSTMQPLNISAASGWKGMEECTSLEPKGPPLSHQAPDPRAQTHSFPLSFLALLGTQASQAGLGSHLLFLSIDHSTERSGSLEECVWGWDPSTYFFHDDGHVSSKALAERGSRSDRCQKPCLAHVYTCVYLCACVVCETTEMEQCC